MVSISLCMIVKNEEDTLGRCLNSVRGIANEIIIADTGSTDRTKDTAYKFTDKVYDFEWVDDFSAARNFSYKHASMDYILWLDADDIILPEDAAKLKKLKKSLPVSVNAVMMKYNTVFDKSGRVIFSCFRERLTRRDKGFKWQEPVHEYIEVFGGRINSEICVTHAKPPGRDLSGGRNIKIYERFMEKGGELTPRGMYYYARELKDSKRYEDAIKWYRRFLDTREGWVEDIIFACGGIASCYLAQKEPEKAILSMLESFTYDTPRAEICCQIGYYFKKKACYKQAAFWFELVLSLDKNESGWGFVREDCWGYIPCLELAKCYAKLEEYDKAKRFKAMAGVYKPDFGSV